MLIKKTARSGGFFVAEVRACIPQAINGSLMGNTRLAYNVIYNHPLTPAKAA
jgi:hypothetical protein